MKLDILAFGVHPDDIELSCSGTLLKHIAAGKKVGLVDLTQGELGTRGTPDQRAEEARAALKKMGARVRVNLEFADGFFGHDRDHLLPIIEVIRHFRPEIVLANALEDRHPDHGRAARLVADAAFLAGLRKIETIWSESEASAPQAAWRPKAVYHYIQDYYIEPDFVVDITPFMPKKLELIKTFRSQFFDPHSTEPETPISGQDFLESVIGKNRTFGRPLGFEFAEGFTCAHPIGVKDLFDLLP
jgi:bacillithiol biosynthesis deacetylase BshB1